MNMGQLRMLLRATYLVDAVETEQDSGQPFKVSEIVEGIRRALEG